MRVEKTIKNIKFAMLYQVSLLLITFIDRKLFLSILGVNYLGLNGLFTNIITMLSLAELGVGTAIIYNLYAPLERGDKEEVAALMRLYKKIYYIIGLAIGMIGLIFMFFLPYVMKEQIYEINYINKVYLIFLVGTVFTYFTGYKRSLLYADQKNYVLLLGDMAANTMGVIAKIGVLLIWRNYIVYIVTHTLFKLIPNIWASHKVNQLYSYIKEIKLPLPAQKLEKVKKDIKDLFIHKISHFVVTSTDNLIISSFIGLGAVGFLSNYNMIIGALMGFIAQGIEALQASMGNLVATESKEKIEDVYNRLSFATFWIACFCAVSLGVLIQPFIRLWLDASYIMESNIVFFVILNFFLWIITRPLWQLLTVSGLFKEDKINAITEMSVNLIFSLLFVYKWGVVGVLAGTAISYIVAWVMKSNLLYKKFFNKPVRKYYTKMGLYVSLTIVQVMITYKVTGIIKIQNDYLKFIIKMATCVIVPNAINYAIFYKTKEFIYFKKLIGDMMMTILEKLGEEKNKLIIQRILFIIVAALIFLLPFERTMDPKWRIIGKLAALGIFAITNLYILYLLMVPKIISKQAKRNLWVYVGIVGGIGFISLFTGGLKVTIMMALMINVGLAMSYIDYKRIGKWIYIVDIGVVAHGMAMVNDYMRLEEEPWLYSYIFNNSNYLGLIAILLIMICFIAYGITRGKRYLIYPLPFIWIIRVSKTRTSMLVLVGILVTLLLWKLIMKYKKIYYSFILLVIIGIISVNIFYPLLTTHPKSQEWNVRIMMKTGKFLFSGRGDIWIESIELAKAKPILGYGMGASLEGLTGGNLSSHNIYLQVLLQGGMVLFMVLMASIYLAWKGLYRVAHNSLVQVGASCLVGILIIGIFELTLLGQSISLGIIQWFIIGAGLSPALEQEETQEIKEMKK